MRPVLSIVLLLVAIHQLTGARIRRQENDDDIDYGEYADVSSNDECKCNGTFRCYCVSPHLCDHGIINTNAGNRLVKFRTISIADQCTEDEKCCANTNELSPETDTTTIATTSTTATTTTSKSTNAWLKCGTRGSWPREDYGSHATKRAEFPWMAAIMIYDEKGELQFLCGASIVRPSVVLTAAHCLEGLSEGDMVIRAGAWNFSDSSEKTQNLNVKFMLRHPEYSYDPPRNDVALIWTEDEFQPTEGVGKVCLPEPGMYFSSEDKCITTGWSDGTDTDETKVSILHRIDVPLVPHQECQRKFRRTILGRFFILHPNFMCAPGKDLDTCKGDGGAPLVCERGGIYYQVGVVSWGLTCVPNKLPTVYADVVKVQGWIEEQLGKYD